MRIAFLADLRGNNDEGMKNTGFHLQHILSLRHDVQALNIYDVFSSRLWRELLGFRPEIVHYIPGPSIASLMIMKLVKLRSGATTIVSALRPTFYGWKGLTYAPVDSLSTLGTPAIPLLRPDLLLVQSEKTRRFFNRRGCRTQYLPSGVDISRFHAIPEADREGLRDKLGLPRDKFVLLHVGHLNRRRNVQSLAAWQSEETQVVIVTGGTVAAEEDLGHELLGSGCIVRRGFCEWVEEYYQAADCYVFPTRDERGCIEMPLSVLEAMATNLPVASTKFAALPEAIPPGDGLAYYNNDAELGAFLRQIRRKSIAVNTRHKVAPFGWESIARQLEDIYRLELGASVVPVRTSG